jgi:SAM-dependent methyltransferase
MTEIEAAPTIDGARVKAFWESQGRKLGSVAVESIANLEERPDLLAEKLRLEQDAILPHLPLRPYAAVLDLGAGVGQWSFRFAPSVRRVVAVEYAESMAAIARAEAERLRCTNVEFVVAAAEDYVAQERFDLIFISGLLLYLTDTAARRVLDGARAALQPGGVVFIRDAISVQSHRHVIANRYSAALRADYSALYRTRPELRAMFAAAGLRLEHEQQVFPEGSRLNKFPETRLYTFKLRAGDGAPA